MSEARAELLSALIDEIAANGMADRSLRALAAAVGTSHRMLLYHFGSRAGLAAAVSAEVDDRERSLLLDLAASAAGPAQLLRQLWSEVSSPERRPAVRMFFESLGSPRRPPGNDDALTAPWLEAGATAAENLGFALDAAEMRLAVAVIRGLLIDVLATGDTVAATESLERFLSMWETPKASR